MSNNGVREKLGLREDPCGIFVSGLAYIHTTVHTVAAGCFAQGRLRRVVCNNDHLLGWDGRLEDVRVARCCWRALQRVALRCVGGGEGRGGQIIVGLTVRPTLLAVHKLRECCSIRWGSSTSGLPLDGSRAGCTHVTAALAGCFPSGRCGASRGLLPAVDGVAL